MTYYIKADFICMKKLMVLDVKNVDILQCFEICVNNKMSSNKSNLSAAASLESS